MSFPTIPQITPTISINRTQVVNLLLASVALEELGLAHIINAEGEKLQAVLGTLPGLSLTVPSFAALISINREVRRTLQTALKSQMLLQFKLEDILDINILPPPSAVSNCECFGAIALAGGQNTPSATSPKFPPPNTFSGRVSGQIRICENCRPAGTQINYNFNSQGGGVNLQFDSQGTLSVDCTDAENGILTVSGQGTTNGTGFAPNEMVLFTLIFDENTNQITLTLKDPNTLTILYIALTNGTVSVGPCS